MELFYEYGIEVMVVNVCFVKLLDMELILFLVECIGKVVIMEEGCFMGGFGLVVVEALMDNNVLVFLKCLGVFDIFVDYVILE